LLRLPVGLGEGGFAAATQNLKGMPEAHSIKPLHKLDGIACLATVARHAAEQALARSHNQIRSPLVIMEGAKPPPVQFTPFCFRVLPLLWIRATKSVSRFTRSISLSGIPLAWLVKMLSNQNLLFEIGMFFLPKSTTFYHYGLL